MSFGAPVRNGLGIGLRASTSLSTRGGAGGGLDVATVFSTYLYTGNDSTQTITNGIDLAGKGGLVWIKARSVSEDHFLVNSASPSFRLQTNTTGAQGGQSLLSLASSGFSLLLGNDAVNGPGITYASWTFREEPNFFDVVTYTGNGSGSQTINHNLGAVPGCIIFKRTDSTSDWPVYHRGHEFAPAEGLALNLTASTTSTYRSLNSVPTATTFTVGAGVNPVNVNGATYVAYLYAHDTSANGIIQCGSYTGNGNSTGPVINLGWEPQWLMIKRYSGATSDWLILDNMRGLPVGSADAILRANIPNTETLFDYVSPTATGFQLVTTNAAVNANGAPYIYIAIRKAA